MISMKKNSRFGSVSRHSWAKKHEAPKRNPRSNCMLFQAIASVVMLFLLLLWVQMQIFLYDHSVKLPLSSIREKAYIGSVVGDDKILRYRENKDDSNDGNEDVPLSDFVAEFTRSNVHLPVPYSEKICLNDTSRLVLMEWKQNHRQLICDTILPVATTRKADSIPDGLIVDMYSLHRWENKPTILRYKNAEAWSMNGPIRTRCRPIDNDKEALLGSSFLPPKKAMHSMYAQEDITDNVIEVNATVIRIVPFDVLNSYERFHAYVNVAMIMLMFNLQDPQLVFVTSSRPDHRPEQGDIEMWRLFSKLKPIFLSGDVEIESDREKLLNSTARAAVAASLPKTRYRFREIIEAPNSWSSMVNTKINAGALRGQGEDHHCKSVLFQAIIEWIKQRADRLHPTEEMARSIDPEGLNSTINILWSSRQPYCCRDDSIRDDSIWVPHRIIRNETQWIDSLRILLGSKYNVTSVDFGTVSTLESIRLAAQSDIIVGVHGAGLIWSVFLPLQKRRSNDSNSSGISGLVEIFAGDRSTGNRHYHNIASLIGCQYRQTKYWGGSDKLIRWNQKRLDEVVYQIRSINTQ